MHINLNNPAGTFPQLSPLFDNTNKLSPYLSPLQNDALRKYSDANDEFLNFKLDEYSENGLERMGKQDFNQRSYTPRQEMEQRSDYLLDQYGEQFQPIVGVCEQHADLNCDPIFDQKLEPPHSTKFLEAREESQQPQLLILNNGEASKVQILVQYLVQNSNKNQEYLNDQATKIFQDSEQLRQIFKMLLSKFKKLKKTKEEMTKYCMRKAFKYIADKMKRDRTHNRDVDTCMKLYFSKNQNGTNFTIPFKKNSIEKTMNGNFLKRVFSSQSFVDDYRQFLRDFRELMIDDNQKKVKYLANMIQSYLNAKDFKGIQSIKRLPWTKDTLTQTESLGVSLLAYADSNEGSLVNLKFQQLEE